MVVFSASRSLAYARKHGWMAGKVERYIHQTKRRIDLFGWCDLIVLDGDALIGVQSCGMGARAKHLDKYREDQVVLAGLRAWIATGARAELWAWRKRKVKRGGKAVRWSHEVTDLSALAQE